jgi:antitoxin (DNA-binding transcriptional repressor) of toxin-antitoxin stability system
MVTVHISVSEAASDFPAVLERVRGGSEIVIESDAGAVAVVPAPEAEVRPKLLSVMFAEEEALERASGEAPIFDSEFADDLEEVIRCRKPSNPPSWD